MRNIIAVARKELGVYFTTPLPYALFAVATVAMGIFLVGFIQKFQEIVMLGMRMPQYIDLSMVNLTDIVISPFISQAGLMVVFVAPFLSMRLIAEERRQRTLEFLMTAPIRTAEIVLGKYIAGVIVLTIAVSLTFAAPFLLDKFAVGVNGAGGIDWSTVRIAFAGLIVWAAAAMAIGLFVSALTDSQAVAAVVSLLVFVLLWSCSWIGNGSSGDGTIQTILVYLAVPTHLDSFLRGVIRREDLVYFASLVIFGLFLTHRAIEGRRWT